MTLYTLTGYESCPPDLERMLLAFRASEWRIFRDLRLPAALPHILTGLRFAAGQAVLMAIVGELFSAQEGIGAVILQQSSLSGYDVMWAASIEGALAGLVFFLAASALARRLTRWS
jgi:NitT/TauT family transport system permease protein